MIAVKSMIMHWIATCIFSGLVRATKMLRIAWVSDVRICGSRSIIASTILSIAWTNASMIAGRLSSKTTITSSTVVASIGMNSLMMSGRASAIAPMTSRTAFAMFGSSRLIVAPRFFA